MGWKLWGRERLPSSAFQDVQDQVVMRFASASARTTELTAPETGMVTYLEDTGAYESRWPDGAWRNLFRPFHGKIWRTAGALAVPAAQVYTVEFGASQVAGGVTADISTVNGHGLVLPIDGLWELRSRGYMTGSAGRMSFGLTRRRASVADVNDLCFAMIDKADLDDRQTEVSDVLPLKVGDRIVQLARMHSGTSSYWGTSERQGVSISATWLGPLAGATPI